MRNKLIAGLTAAAVIAGAGMMVAWVAGRDDGAAPAAITKAQFVRRADTLCTQFVEEVDEILWGRDGNGGRGKPSKSDMAALKSATQSVATGFAALGSPAGLEATTGKLTGLLDEATVEAKLGYRAYVAGENSSAKAAMKRWEYVLGGAADIADELGLTCDEEG